MRGDAIFARYWAEHSLPAGYRRVEYLDSNATAYIRAVTGEVDNTYGIEAEFSMDFIADNYPAGFSVTSNKRFLFWGTQNSMWRYGWGVSSTGATYPLYPIDTYPFGVANFYYGNLNFLNNGKCVFANNQPADITGYGDTFTNTDFLLFKSYSLVIRSRFKCARISKGAQLVRDFVPCVRVSDGKPGMYDLCGSICPLTSTPFYVNAGTGADFAWGELNL